MARAVSIRDFVHSSKQDVSGKFMTHIYPVGGMLKGVKSWFGSNKETKASGKTMAKKLSPEDDPDTIHIFTIASGHMYERLQKIMILSLIRNTKSVKLLPLFKLSACLKLQILIPCQHYRAHLSSKTCLFRCAILLYQDAA